MTQYLLSVHGNRDEPMLSPEEKKQMKATEVVRVTTVVAVDPAAAFAIFTDEIAMWWRPKVDLFRKGQKGRLRFESGRLI